MNFKNIFKRVLKLNFRRKSSFLNGFKRYLAHSKNDLIAKDNEKTTEIKQQKDSVFSLSFAITY